MHCDADSIHYGRDSDGLLLANEFLESQRPSIFSILHCSHNLLLVCACLRMSGYACVCMCISGYACVRMCIILSCICLNMSVYACVCLCMPVYACMCFCVCISVYVCVCLCVSYVGHLTFWRSSHQWLL